MFLTDCLSLQSNLAFVGLLNRVRRGQQTPEDLQVLRNCKSCGSASDASAERPTILFSTNKPVDEMNERQLRQLGGEMHIFKSDDEGSAEGKKMLDQFNMVSKKVELKVGAEVMMTKNVSVTDGLVRFRICVSDQSSAGMYYNSCCFAQVNGARGVVVGFGNGQSGPQHSKSLLPIVKFHGMTEPQVVGTEKFQAFLAGAEAATRSQIPLKLAWAISIHKSQGVSISHVKASTQAIRTTTCFPEMFLRDCLRFQRSPSQTSSSRGRRMWRSRVQQPWPGSLWMACHCLTI